MIYGFSIDVSLPVSHVSLRVQDTDTNLTQYYLEY